MNSILVATDLSKENKILLDRALEIASKTKSELHILHVLYVVRFEPNDDIFLIEEKKCRKLNIAIKLSCLNYTKHQAR